MKNVVVLFDEEKNVYCFGYFFFPKDLTQTRVICDLEHLLRMSHFKIFFRFQRRKGVD